jgi:hypothetical protein
MRGAWVQNGDGSSGASITTAGCFDVRRRALPGEPIYGRSVLPKQAFPGPSGVGDARDSKLSAPKARKGKTCCSVWYVWRCACGRVTLGFLQETTRFDLCLASENFRSYRMVIMVTQGSTQPCTLRDDQRNHNPHF